jgi:predicted CXXCH cytochrome family protein
MLQRLISRFPGRRLWLLVLGALVFLFLFFLGSVELLDYTESVAFCTACHTMYPEKTVYQISPHQNVGCGTCHIGPGAVPAVQAKLASVRYLWEYPLNLYTRPIPSPVHSLRPVEVVCEQCHWPQKFYTDRLLEISHFGEDEANSRTDIYLLLKTGGGTQREGLGKGIHWHIENVILYRAADEQLQDIPWIQTEIDGVTTVYTASNTKLTPDQIAALPVHRLDCIDCHNRATHVFRSPSDALDQALANGQLSVDLPDIKSEGVKLLAPFYASQDAGAQTIADDLKAFYAAQYPAVSAAKVDKAAAVLGGLYRQIKFPDMKTDWRVHPNNIGHKDSAGCFRCHDGQHFTQDKQSIRLECNICHTIPQVATKGSPAPLIAPVPSVPEPPTHQDSNWIAQHHNAFDKTCSVCHDTANAGGTDNSSFCSNSACHGTKWKFAGLDAPGILEVSHPTQSIASQAAPIPHPVAGREDCLVCHGPQGVRPFPADHAGRSKDICVGCHVAPAEEVAPAPAGATPTVPSGATPAAPPAIPHTLEGRADCLLCHGPSGVLPFPADHAGRTDDTCTGCHAPPPEPTPTPSPTPEPTAAAPTAQPAGAAPTAPAIPHSLEGRADCLVCHGPDGVRPFPADHAGRGNDTCTGCHASPAPTAAATAAAGLPPAIPHSLEGRADCLVCHGPNGVRPFPADHAGRGNDICTGCHAAPPGSAPAGAAPTTPAGAAPTTPAGAAPTTPAGAAPTAPAGAAPTAPATLTITPVSAPGIPHSLEGRADCLACHASGEESVPDDHAGRTSATCTVCHKPGGGED